MEEVGNSAESSRQRTFDRWVQSVRVETLTTEAPHNAIKAESLSVFLGGVCLVANADLKIPAVSRTIEIPLPSGHSRTVRRGTCYGLVGPNGCGKSTILRLISEARIPLPSGWEPFLVGQHLPAVTSRSALEEVLSADSFRLELVAEKSELEQKLVSISAEGREVCAEAFVAANSRFTDVQQQLLRWDHAPAEIEQILISLGFSRKGATPAKGNVKRASEAAVSTTASAWAGQGHDQPSVEASMSDLSGGWRMKVEIAKALWLKPQLLLLDEPTNHLDFEALQWLEKQLDEYPCTTVVVSHDVTFLHSVCRDIFLLKDRSIQSMSRDVVSQEDLARMQQRKGLNFKFAMAEEGTSHHGLSLHNVEFSHPKSAGGASSRIRAERIRLSARSRAILLGRNGSGKSTCLNLCAGILLPSRGTVDKTDGCRIGLYTQLMDEVDCYADMSAVEFLVAIRSDELKARLDVKSQAAARAAERRVSKVATATMGKRLKEVARGVLSNFGFDGDMAVSVPIGSLSGGQKARLKLAALAVRPAHILLLDEPTNHLDAAACEALAAGLSEFKGGVVVVTHDDTLIYNLIQCNWASSELLVCSDGNVRNYKNFSGHCLKTLKAEMRRSERDSLSKPCIPPINQPSRPSGEPCKIPPWLAQSRSNRRRVLESAASVDVVTSEMKEFLKNEDKTPRNNTGKEEPSANYTDHFASLDVPEDVKTKPGTSHSRLRKDLVNLNKAVKKWLVHERIGVLTRPKVEAKILSSAAATRLMESHGNNFEKNIFVKQALERSGASEEPVSA